ncbi:DUF433 domain-containing protein [Candidatus Entotheonella palauensis]|uniref:DUF433 domain-containing protein n=1 Tax=Candidatus Entotheonella gemina TaxID=1429439 RepID=W4M1T9_9BACT|nr:DUF433 domain-containing protein [Candidatus Entotheonella palauensis]ETX03911.1 MAG: hypothetical protein ETSY2_31835 [Candidatus Entotheonella gemina]
MRIQIPATVDLAKYIETSMFGDRPHIRGRRVPVATIVHSACSQQWGVSELAYQFSLSEAEVLAALLYYEEHKGDIEAQEMVYQAELDRMNGLYGKD